MLFLGFSRQNSDAERKKALFRIDANTQSMSENMKKQEKLLNQSLRCEPELDCASCDAQFECVTARWGATTSGCCPPGTKMACCVKFTTTTTPTTPTTTTTTAMTTTTDENLFCKKAFFEQHPEGDKYHEEADKKCTRSDRHCYVLNCTTVSSSPSFDRFIGYKVEWGCSVTKEGFMVNFNQSKGRLGSGRFPGSKCNFVVGEKNQDMHNHNINAPIFNATYSSLWCKGGYFWENSYHEKNITVCKAHEHYCYVQNCTLELVGQVGSTESKHHILTKWGCTDKMPKQLLDKPGQFIGQNTANRIIVHKCTPKVGKANIPMSNAGNEVPIPSQKCKKAFLSKWLNESSDKSCSQSQRYCYVLNCSTAVESDKPGQIMTEWGCTDRQYGTGDFLQGKGRQLSNAYSNPMPNNSTCTSSVSLNSNEGVMLPIPSRAAKTFNSTLICKQGSETPSKKTDYTGTCLPGENACYAIHCFHTEHLKKPVKEWGCTSNASQICAQKISEFGYNMSNKNETCNCSFDTAKQKLPLKTAMKMKSSDVEGGWHHASDQRALAGSRVFIWLFKSKIFKLFQVSQIEDSRFNSISFWFCRLIYVIWMFTYAIV